MKFSVAIYDRDFSGVQLTPVGAAFEVSRYSFDVLGGPFEAAIQVIGSLPAISELIQRLRCPIEIYDEAGALVWWGFIREVTASVNGWEFGASLDSMSNKVAVAYSFVDPGSATVGTRKTTAWTSDLDSISEYGIKAVVVIGRRYGCAGPTDARSDPVTVQVSDCNVAGGKGRRHGPDFVLWLVEHAGLADVCQQRDQQRGDDHANFRRDRRSGAVFQRRGD
jgi:hypothetical protein